MNDIDRALLSFERASEIDPSNVHIKFQKAKAHYDRGDLQVTSIIF